MNPMPQKFSYRLLLLEELNRRKSHNPAYSLRAFGRDMGVSITALSQVLAGKRHLSKKNVERIANKLSLSPMQTARINNEISGLAVDRDACAQVQEDIFKMMSDWYYFAILNLAKLKSNRADTRWISERLNISENEAQVALSRLMRLGYIEVTGRKLKRTTPHLITTQDIPSSAQRKFQKQNLVLAAGALDMVPLELREITSVTFAFDVRKMRQAKELIRKFRTKISKFGSDENTTEVYMMGIQFFPLTH